MQRRFYLSLFLHQNAEIRNYSRVMMICVCVHVRKVFCNLELQDSTRKTGSRR
jgi:hypothetical protein